MSHSLHTTLKPLQERNYAASVHSGHQGLAKLSLAVDFVVQETLASLHLRSTGQ
jgi:hypothetical protein